MSLKIKATDEEHRLACSNGCVYGRVSGNKHCYAYAELGREVEHRPRHNEDLREDRRDFKDCTVYFALTPEDLNNGYFEDDVYRGRVQIYK